MEVVPVTDRVTTAVEQREEEDVARYDDTGGHAAQTDGPPTRLSKRAAAKVVVAETGCTLNEARNMIDWLDGFVAGSRSANYSTMYPTTRQMSGRNYEIFDQIMPHDAAPTPGTAAAAVNSALLDPTKGETYILHDQRERFDAVYCSVTVQTLAVQLS